MIRKRLAIPGAFRSGTLSWTRGDQPAGNISYSADLTDPLTATLKLAYTRGSGPDKESVKQEIVLTSTQPHFGGSRWWMICPYGGGRCSKLYLPPNGDRFASRKAWRLGYRSQRSSPRDRAFDKLNRLQRKLGCPEGYEQWLKRPKGMWHRTFERHQERFHWIEHQCDIEMALCYAKLRGLG